ncbi:MAG: mechanosensitive ion channel domain-containing protein [Desulfobacterales bacterium]
MSTTFPFLSCSRGGRAAYGAALLLGLIFLAGAPAFASAGESAGANEEKAADAPVISIARDMDDVLRKEAEQVGAELRRQVLVLSRWTPLGWDFETLHYLSRWFFELPLRLPEFLEKARAEGRTLGIAGSLLVLVFLAAVLYSVFGRNRVMRGVASALSPERTRIPEPFYPYFLAALRVVVAAAIPLLLLALYRAITAVVIYRAAWFALAGELLGLWSAASLVIALLRELLTSGLFPTTAAHGRRVFRTARPLLLGLFLAIAFTWAAEAFRFRADVVAFIRFAVSVAFVFLFLLLMLQKRALLSFLPDLPYASYRTYLRLLDRFFYPLVGLSFLLALLWCFGFREAGRVLLVKVWFTVAALALLTGVYHALRIALQRWAEKVPAGDEGAQVLVRSLRALLLYAAGIATAGIALNLLGLLDLAARILSFPIVVIGGAPISVWILVKAALIVYFFVLGARLLQAFLDYKVYPVLRLHPGTGFALNALVRYATIGAGTLIALDSVGVDLRLILVFAGAIGIGIGLGLQNLAANFIAGFIVLFGGKVRRGDWIEVGGTLGEVVDISLLATRLRTRANVEYLTPNSSLLSNTIVNYSLSSPMVWVGLNVGVAYGSDPRRVERILLEVARREPLVSRDQPPRVLFTEFADSALVFRLLVWIDVRRVAEGVLKSALYFAIFDEFRKAGIEIPFPQRDLHIRSLPSAQAAAVPLNPGSAAESRDPGGP